MAELTEADPAGRRHDAQALEAELRRAQAALEHLAALAYTRRERAEYRGALANERAAVAEYRAIAAEQALAESHAATLRMQARGDSLEQRLAAEMTGHYEAQQREQQLVQRLRAEMTGHYEAQQREQLLIQRLQATGGGQVHPLVARRLRQGVKLVWWAATLQLPRRYALWRRHQQSLTLVSTTPPEQSEPPDLDTTCPGRPTPEPPVFVSLTLDPPAPDQAVAEPVIAFAVAVEPRLSVVISTHGQFAATLVCLRSLARHPPRCAIEIIVVDDACAGSDDMTPLTHIEGIVLLRHPVSLGHAQSCNQAAQIARGEAILLLDGAAELCPGAVDALFDLLQARPDAGLVGSRLMFPNGELRQAGGILWSDASSCEYGRGEDKRRPEYNFVREVDYCAGAASMVRRSVWNQVGGYDEAFAPTCFWDADLAFRIRAVGSTVLYEPRSEIVHHGGAQHAGDIGSARVAKQEADRADMVARWGEVLRRDHCEPGQHILRAAGRANGPSRGGRKTILVIDHRVPEPDRDAGSRSMVCLITSLVDAGWLVKFWPHNRVAGGPYTTALEAIGIEVLDHRWPGDLDHWLDRFGGDLDHLLVSRPDVAVATIPKILHRTDAVLSFYGVDLHFARMRRQALLDGDSQLRIESFAVERLERQVWRNCDVVLYPSEDEAGEVRQMAPGTLARSIVGFWFRAAPARVSPPPGRSLLFVAGFAHPPNVDAAQYLVEELVPLLEAAIGPVTVTLAGSNPGAAVCALAGRDVTVTGWMTDDALRALYDRHRVVVAPLRFGAGVKGKVVEALALGAPLVTTSIGAQGIPTLDQIIPVADTAEALVAALTMLLRGDDAWVAQSARQVAFAEQAFSRAAMGRSVVQALEAGEAARIEHPHSLEAASRPHEADKTSA